MSSTWVPLALVVLVLAMIPLALKWLQRRMGVHPAGSGAELRLVSALAVGPHQRVVTVEAGPQEARVWLTLGVTAQAVHCLHVAPVADKRMQTPAPAAAEFKLPPA